MGKELSRNIIQMKAAKLGKLVVNSVPNGADIFVDEAKWPGTTNNEGFADVGQRRVRVQKGGLQPAETMCNVMRDRVATFSAKLLASGSQADCMGTNTSNRVSPGRPTQPVPPNPKFPSPTKK